MGPNKTNVLQFKVMDTGSVTWKMQYNTAHCGKCQILLRIMCFEILNTSLSFQEMKLDPLFEMRSSFEGRMHQVHVYIEVLIVSRLSVGRLDNACLGGEWNLIFQKLVKPQNLSSSEGINHSLFTLNLTFIIPQF